VGRKRRFSATLLEHAKALDHESAVPCVNLGNVYSRWAADKPSIRARALYEYDCAIRIDECMPEAWNNRGVAKEDSSDFEGAIEDYRQATRLHRTYTDAYSNLSRVLFNTRRDTEFIPAYSEFLRLADGDPSYAEAGIAFNKIAISVRTHAVASG
jgi:tetratricopeptide (TPR) repeat protein